MFFDETCANYWQLMAIYCMISWAQHVLRNCEACGQWPRASVPHMFHHVPFLHWMYGYETDMKWIWNGYEWYWYLLNLLVAWHFHAARLSICWVFLPKVQLLGWCQRPRSSRHLKRMRAALKRMRAALLKCWDNILPCVRVFCTTYVTLYVTRLI